MLTKPAANQLQENFLVLAWLGWIQFAFYEVADL